METIEIAIEELGVSQLYLNQRKLEAVREQYMAEDFAGFDPLPVYDFGDGRGEVATSHLAIFQSILANAEVAIKGADKVDGDNGSYDYDDGALPSGGSPVKKSSNGSLPR